MYIRNTYRMHGGGSWRARMMHTFGMDTMMPLRKGELTIPSWVVGKSVIFYFIAMIACLGAFGYVPETDFMVVSGLSVILFFYGGAAMSRSYCHTREKAFLRNVYLVGLIVRLIWLFYCYFIFNEPHFGAVYGETADVEWYLPFAKDISLWLSGNYSGGFSHVLSVHSAAVDDIGYPMWLAIGYLFWGDYSDVFIPMLIKCFVSAYCAICIYHVAKRHFGDGTARMAAIFVCLNPNMIYWCGNMFKESEMVFLCCVFVNEVDKAFSSNRFDFNALWPGLLAGFSLFFFRAALGIAAFVAVFAHIVMASQRVMSAGKKIIAGVLVAITLLVGMGDSLRTKTEKIFESAQAGTDQKANMEWRSEREGGNAFAKYASAAVFAPLIFTIPFPTFNVAYERQILQIQLGGGSYIKNIFSFFVIMVLFILLISGEWRRHVFIIAYTCGYIGVLVLSNFAQSGRFHMPIWPMLLLFAAYGIQLAKSKPRMRRLFMMVLALEVVACIAWNWFKLAGRGMV